jgi:regulator of sigma E protease
MPAYGHFKAGDVITKAGGKPVRSWQDLKEAVEPNPNKPVEFEVLREGEKSVTFTIKPSYLESGVGAIGLSPRRSNVFAHVVEGSLFHRAGLRSGDKLVWIDGQGGALTLDGKDKIPGLFERSEKPRTIAIKVDRKGEKESVPITLKTEPVVEADLAAAGLETGPRGILALHDSRPYRKRTFSEAVSAGLYEPYDVAVMTFEILKKLVTGGESAKGLSGPIGIIHVSYRSADLSFGNFLWLLCLITVNLGIFNLLPIPVLDGGHNVLLAIEVVRRWMGKPPPTEKFVAAFQYAGLVFILALFLFVTYNDFSRLFGGG